MFVEPNATCGQVDKSLIQPCYIPYQHLSTPPHTHPPHSLSTLPLNISPQHTPTTFPQTFLPMSTCHTDSRASARANMCSALMQTLALQVLITHPRSLLLDTITTLSRHNHHTLSAQSPHSLGTITTLSRHNHYTLSTQSLHSLDAITHAHLTSPL